MDFHIRLTKRRRELGISIRKICRDLGVAKSTYEKWETHRFPKHPEMYKRLSDYLMVSMEYLMLGTDTYQRRLEALKYFEKFMRLMRDSENASNLSLPKI